ncbi:hypothetical protein [Corynebacterium pyruviciproducens]
MNEDAISEIFKLFDGLKEDEPEADEMDMVFKSVQQVAESLASMVGLGYYTFSESLRALEVPDDAVDDLSLCFASDFLAKMVRNG